MSNFQAIAGVSSTLRTLLRDRMEQPVDVTIAPPDVTIPSLTGQRINLYLFQLTENGALKNQEIPGQGHPADYGRPPLSLDLQFLVTAFGSSDTNPDADLQAQQILGDAMRVFHDHAIITEALHLNGNPADPPILDASLVGEFERIKVTLRPPKLDELSNLFSALPQANFRRSVVYEVSAVQIESRVQRQSALPVRVRQVTALPLRTPQISEIVRDPPFDGVRSAVAESGDTILILGQNLGGEAVNVRFGETSVPVPPGQDTRISLAIPVSLAAGLHPVQVTRDLLLPAETGQPPVAHQGSASNMAPLLVVPQLTGIAPNPAAAGAVVTATVAPPALASQERVLLVGDFEVSGAPVATDAPPNANVDFPLPSGASAIPAGTYLTRVRIDGAESRLSFDAGTGLYDGPELTLS